MKKETVLNGFLLVALCLAQGTAVAETAKTPLDLHTCQRVVAGLYDGRLPLQVDALTVRRAVQCAPGLTKPSLIHHEDHIQETVSPQELARMRPAVERKGPDNALVRQRCSEPAFRTLLDLADVAFLLRVQGELLGTVTISADMCPPQSPLHAELRH